jgi:hypothetical protein
MVKTIEDYDHKYKTGFAGMECRADDEILGISTMRHGICL